MSSRIENVEQLEEVLSRPTPEVVESMRRLEGDLIVLGVGGKIGPTLARMARRASDLAGVRRRVIGVDRFISPELTERLQSQGIETIRCDLLDRGQLSSLPDAPNVLHLAAMKFGSTGQEARTWAMNTYLPGMVCEKFRSSRIAAFSTGNVYGMVPVTGNGSVETDPPHPDGDYAMSCLGRERIFTHFSQTLGIRAALLRLNYATELRYGVLVDVGQQVAAGEPVDVTMGYLNSIWQAESSAMTLRAFDHVASPPAIFNVAGPEKLAVRDVAQAFGRRLDRPVTICGQEAPDALLSDGRQAYDFLGRPTVTSEQMIDWIADWLSRGGPTHGKPTHFQSRDGKF